jgi:hypothetical protein
VQEWAFAGKIAPTFLEEYDSLKVSSPSTALTWSGKAVLSGTVGAFIPRSGRVDTLSAALVVTDRTGPAWTWNESKWNLQHDGAPTCAYTDFLAPGTIILAANRRTVARCSVPGDNPGGSIEPDVDASGTHGGIVAQRVPSGPNESLWYVASADYRMDHTSEMNPSLRESGRKEPLTDKNDIAACGKNGFNKKSPIVVNFLTYNTVCQVFSLTPMFDGLWAHEEYGNPLHSLDPATANGHEARRQIAARDPSNNPFKVERFVRIDSAALVSVARLQVRTADSIISVGADTDHVYVRNNYVQQNGQCGQSWVDSTLQYKYQLTPMYRLLPDSTRICH